MTEVTADIGVTGETGDEDDMVTVTVTTISPQKDVILTLPDSSDQIKPQNIEKAVFTLIIIARRQEEGNPFPPSLNTKQAINKKTATFSSAINV